MEIHLAIEGQRSVPYTEDQVRALLAARQVTSETLAWHPGLANWVPLNLVLDDSPPPLHAAMRVRPPAPALARLFAALVDLSVIVLVYLPIIIIIGALPPVQRGQEGPVVLGMLLALTLPLLILMIIQGYFLSKRGQTLGKIVMNIRIARMNSYRRPGFTHAFLLRFLFPALLSCIPVLGQIFLIVDYCFIFREDRRCLHDLMADTQVISVDTSGFSIPTDP